MSRNYIEALQTFLQQDNEISAVVGDRIGFIRLNKDTPKPCIVFNEQERSPEMLDGQDFTSGVDIFPVLVDVIIDYKDSIKGREIRQLIRKKIGNFSGTLAKKDGGDILREGNINFIKFLSCDYNHEVDGVLRGGLYLFKEHYDYNNN